MIKLNLKSEPRHQAGKKEQERHHTKNHTAEEQDESPFPKESKKESTGMDAIKFKIPTQTPSGKDVDLTRANIIVQKKIQDA